MDRVPRNQKLMLEKDTTLDCSIGHGLIPLQPVRKLELHRVVTKLLKHLLKYLSNIVALPAKHMQG